MKAERVILSFIAILVGLFAAGITFYIYQSTRTIPPQDAKPMALAKPTAMVTAAPNDTLLTVESPTDEAVFDKKSVTINGKTVPGATVIVSTQDDDQIVQPSSNGDFTLTMTIPDGTSIIHITAVQPNGEEKELERTVTFSTESF